MCRREEFDRLPVQLHCNPRCHAIFVLSDGAGTAKVLCLHAAAVEEYYLSDSRQTLRQFKELVLSRAIVWLPRFFNNQFFACVGILHTPTRRSAATDEIQGFVDLLEDGERLGVPCRAGHGQGGPLLPRVGNVPLDAIVEPQKSFVR